ncbi:MAG TPA: FUSC family protein [Streptosporangiaceae bacterium]|nr:FUSC family protein [Streptosporangiaceae bacterium]
MIRAALAICLPLGIAFAAGKTSIGLLPAMGGLLGSLTDRGGSYLNRVKRVSAVGVFGGAVGLAVGSAIHGRGWIAVIALVVIAGVSAVLSTIGDIGSQVGLQLLVYASLGIGPFGGLRPVWHTAAGFLVGVVWALVLILPGWLLAPHGQDQRYVAAVYQALAGQLAAIGTDAGTGARQAVTAAVNTAYDELLSARAVAAGRNRTTMRLIAALNASNQMSQAATTLGVAGNRPPPMVIETVRRLAEAIRTGSQPPMIPPVWDTSPGALALRDAMAGLARVLARDWTPGDRTRAALAVEAPPAAAGSARDVVVDRVLRVVGGGQVSRTFLVRLMACMGVAGLVSEVLPLQRSYWVPLTVAIVLKPDYGSVFARALQRGIGTIVGAVLGAVLLAAVHGAWLLVPFGVLAALLPYGRNRNYGLLATFLTPLVVVLVDLLKPTGWRLAGDRLVDTLIGCAIVLVIGFAPWPMAWYAQLPGKFGQAALDVCGYMREALGASAPSGSPVAAARSRRLRATYRALGDLRAEFQRTMSEPPSVSRGATAWWPALVGLEQVLDAVTAVSLAVGRGARVPDAGVGMLCRALDAVSRAASDGTPVPSGLELPDDETLEPVTEAVRALLGVLASGERLTAA